MGARGTKSRRIGAYGTARMEQCTSTGKICKPGHLGELSSGTQRRSGGRTLLTKTMKIRGGCSQAPEGSALGWAPYRRHDLALQEPPAVIRGRLGRSPAEYAMSERAQRHTDRTPANTLQQQQFVEVTLITVPKLLGVPPHQCHCPCCNPFHSFSTYQFLFIVQDSVQMGFLGPDSLPWSLSSPSIVGLQSP